MPRRYEKFQEFREEKGIDEDTRIFICRGSASEAVRLALLRKGWAENEQEKSAVFDLKWTCKPSQATRNQKLPRTQMVNHFPRGGELDMKSTALECFKSDPNWVNHFPRSYDLRRHGLAPLPSGRHAGPSTRG